jgi:amino acid transporter
VTTLTEHDDDAVLPRFGYRQQFVRSLRHFESFAVAFSFISITTGIFTTFAFALGTGGPRAIWTWPIVIVGQTLVALVYGALAARVPLSGYSYQWASRLANVHVGWWLGWMSFAFLSIVTVSVDYGLVQVAFQPLIGQAYTPTSAALETLVVLVLQAALIIWSTRITTRVNNTAVATELIGILGLTVLLIVVAAIRGLGHWSNLTSTGTVPAAGYYAWLGPFMLATLLGAYTIVGFESASNLAEETHEPHRVIPRAMVRAVVASGVVGMAFLIALAYSISDIPAATKSSAPVAFIVNDVLGGVVQKFFLIFVVISIFACGLIIMVTNSRLIWSMSRDRRLPGLPAVAAGAEGDRRPDVGHGARRGHRRGDHARAAYAHVGAGYPVHRVDDHARTAVREHGAAVRVHRPQAARRGGLLLARALGDPGDRGRADLARL